MTVEFNETEYAPRAQQAPRRSAITSLVIKMGLAKDEKQASVMLLWIIAACVLLTLAIWLVPMLTSEPVPPPVVLPQ